MGCRCQGAIVGPHLLMTKSINRLVIVRGDHERVAMALPYLTISSAIRTYYTFESYKSRVVGRYHYDD
jgi:hypothetical protein